MNMDTDEDDWTDDETNETVVKQINKLPLSELRDVISSILPSFSFNAKNGLVYNHMCLTSGTFTLSRYIHRRLSPNRPSILASSS